jgi:hypothetical protein
MPGIAFFGALAGWRQLLILRSHRGRQSSQLTAHKGRGLDCADYRGKSCSYRYEPNIENVRALIASTLDRLVAVCLIAPNLENVLKLLVRERMQVWPYYVVLIVAFILFQPLRNRVVGTYWCEREQYQERRSQHELCSWR